ncbi:MAG: acyltransferase family protein [Caulobacter sp.]
MKKFDSIESLRGWMAWWVVIGHAFHISGTTPRFPNPFVILNYGGWAVAVFMIISGFVIAHMLSVREEPYGRYMVRRAFRLYPIYLFCLVIALLITQYYLAAYFDNAWAKLGDMRAEKVESEAAHFWTHIAAHLAMAHGLVPEEVLPFAAISFLGPAWSLSLEWQFYVLAPLLVWAVTARGMVSYAVLVVAAAVAIPARFGLFGTWVEPAFLPLALEFFLAGIISRIALDPGGLRRAVPGILLLLTVCAAAVIAKPATLITYTFVGAIWVFALCAVNVESGKHPERWPAALRWLFRTTLDNPVAAWLGRISFSTYLIHIPILTLTVGVGVRHFGVESHAQVIALTVLAFPIIVAASHVLYVTIEQPGVRAGQATLKWMARGKATPATSPTPEPGDLKSPGQAR